MFPFWNVAQHVGDIFLHAIVSVLVYYVGARVCSFSVARAALAAILFAIHPVHVEAVANITGRAEALSALFSLLAILVYHSSTASLSSQWSVDRFKWWISFQITSLLVICSTLSKETGTMAARCVPPE